MIVVADTSPLNYLILIDAIELLPAIYQTVLIPAEVHRELQNSSAPVQVGKWASALPRWCSVAPSKPSTNLILDDIDAGERAAIELALDKGIDTLLIDDSEGRRIAQLHHLEVAGTVAILEKAAQLHLIHFQSALERLQTTNFRLSKSLRDDFLRRNR